jgi:hypothetical protein
VCSGARSYCGKDKGEETKVRGRWGILVLVVLASTAVLTTSAGASTQRSGAITISTRTQAMQYLASIGVNARGVVVQRGSHNYAGPNCPGKGWTCTTAKRVLQVATREGDDNKFFCTPSTGGTSSSPDSCTIVQVSSGGQNVAFCREKSDSPTADQNCSVQQSNTTGGNWLLIDQNVNAHDGATQLTHQYGGVIQENGSGTNAVEIHQDTHQDSHSVDSTGAQAQNGYQAASVTQTSGTGDNVARIDQSLAEHAEAKGGASVSQTQNTLFDTEFDTSVNSNAGVDQVSTGGGRNIAKVNQQNQYDAHVGKTGTGTQQQGNPDGGSNVVFNQDSTGLSTVSANQNEHQNMQADRGGSVTQSQFGPMWSDPSQGTNPGDKYDIDQRSDQHASSPSAQQDDQQWGECHTFGNCTVDQKIQQQGQNFTNSCGPAQDCVETQHVADGVNVPCNTDISSEESVPCTFPPQGPPPPFRIVGCEFDCSAIKP